MAEHQVASRFYGCHSYLRDFRVAQSGGKGLLPVPRPLRTAHTTFIVDGSSLSNAPLVEQDAVGQGIELPAQYALAAVAQL